MSDLLRAMERGSRRRVAAARAGTPEAELRRRIADRPPPIPLRLHGSGFDLIAEFKPASPAAGPLLDASAEPRGRAAAAARCYAAAGAAAISVLTEPERFGGDLSLLAAAADASPAPVLRKDFLVDPYQVLEARAAGAAAVLLIARLVDPATLAGLLSATLEQGMFALVELFDEEDLERAAGALADVAPTARERVLVGVNSRDLRTLRVDRDRLGRLVSRLPEGFPRVAESGIESDPDAAEAARLGYRLALVGTALMRAADPGERIAGLLEAARATLAARGRERRP